MHNSPTTVCSGLLGSLSAITSHQHQHPTFNLNQDLCPGDESEFNTACDHANASCHGNNVNERRFRFFTAVSADEPSKRLSITWEDAQRMMGTGNSKWLNCSLINLWFWTFRQRERRQAQTCGSETNFFCTHIFTLLLEKNRYCYEAAQKHTKNVDTFAFKRLFFPVNKNDTHWFCLAIFMEERKIVSYDSMGGGDNLPFLLIAFRFLVDECRFKNGQPLPGRWTLHQQGANQNIPQQVNGWDCGLYTCIYADRLSSGCSLDFTPNQVQKCRKLFSLSIFCHDECNPQPPFGPCIPVREKVPQTAAKVTGAPPFEAVELVNVIGTQWEVVDRVDPVLQNTVVIDFSFGSDQSKSNGSPIEHAEGTSMVDLTHENESTPASVANPKLNSAAASKELSNIEAEHQMVDLSHENESTPTSLANQELNTAVASKQPSDVEVEHQITSPGQLSILEELMKGHDSNHVEVEHQIASPGQLSAAASKEPSNVEVEHQMVDLAHENESTPTSLANQELNTAVASKQPSDVGVEHQITRPGPGQLSILEELMKGHDTNHEDRSSSEDESCSANKKMLIKNGIESVKGKRFNFDGTFSSPSGDYCASIDVSFDRTEHILDVTMNCQEHPIWISDLRCPCRCILEMDRHIRKLTSCWPCKDFSYLYPAAYQSSKAHEAVKDAEKVTVTLPNFGDDFPPLRDSASLSLVMDAAPKYQNCINGRRFRSNGEINTAARKHPKNRREGGRKRLTKDTPMPQLTSKRRKTIDGDMCSYHTNHKHYIKKEVKPSLFAVIDPQATGSIYTGDSRYIFNNHSTDGGPTVTVNLKSGKLSCPLVTLAGVAKTWGDEKFFFCFTT